MTKVLTCATILKGKRTRFCSKTWCLKFTYYLLSNDCLQSSYCILYIVKVNLKTPIRLNPKLVSSFKASPEDDNVVNILIPDRP